MSWIDNLTEEEAGAILKYKQQGSDSLSEEEAGVVVKYADKLKKKKEEPVVEPVKKGFFEANFENALSIPVGMATAMVGLKKRLGHISDEEYQDAIESAKKFQQSAEIGSEQHPISTTGSKIAGAIASAAPFTAIGGAAAALPTKLTKFVRPDFVAGLGAASAIGSGYGGERYAELLNKGVDEELAAPTALVGGTVTGATALFPASMAGGLATRVLTGAGLNTAGGELTIAAENALLGEQPEGVKQHQFDPRTMALNAGIGGVVGGVLGPKAKGTTELPPPETKATPSELAASDQVIKIQQKEIESLSNKSSELSGQLQSISNFINSLQKSIEERGGTPKQFSALNKAVEQRKMVEGKLQEVEKLIHVSKSSLDKEVGYQLKQRGEVLEEPAQTPITPDGEVPVKAATEETTKVPDQETPAPIAQERVVDPTLAVDDTIRNRAARRQIENTFAEREVDPVKKAAEEELAWKEREAAAQSKEATERSLDEQASIKDDLLREFKKNQQELEHRLSIESDLTEQGKAFKKSLDEISTAADNLINEITALQKKSVVEANSPPSKLRWVDPELKTKIDNGGLVGGLRYVIEKLPDHPVSIVAKAILDNPRVRPEIGVHETPLITKDGAAGVFTSESATPNQGRVDLAKAGTNPITFIHEMVHAATMRALEWSKDAFLAQKLSLTERVATKNLEKLFAFTQDKIPKHFSNAAKDIKEFLSEGLTDTNFQKWLSELKYDGRSGLSKFTDSILNILGLKSKEEKNALRVLLGETDTLIKEASGSSTSGYNKVVAYSKLDYFDDVTAKTDIGRLKKDIESGKVVDAGLMYIRRLGINYFGDMQWVDGVKKKMPLVWAAYKINNLADRASVAKYRDWLNDTSTAMSEGIKSKLTYNSLKLYEHKNSVSSLIKEVSWEDMNVLHALFKKGFDAELHYDVNLQQNGAHLTDIQRRMYEATSKMFQKMALDTGIKHQRPGWYPAVRNGEFGVSVWTPAGNMFHMETFRTKAEAELFMEKVGAEKKFRAELIDKDIMESMSKQFIDIQDILRKRKFGNDADANYAANVLERVRTEMAEGAGLGSHDMRRLGFSGYAGDQWFKSQQHLGENFKQSILDAANDFASKYKKRVITKNLEPLLNDTFFRERVPNQVELATALRDYAVNDYKDFAWAKGLQDGINKYIEDPYVRLIDMVNKKYNLDIEIPRVSLTERSSGVAAQLFYVSALTTRPAFWAAQVLSSPFSLRQLLREGSLFETHNAAWGGVWDVITGGNKEFRVFVAEMANKGDSLHPQFINDINAVGRSFFDAKGHATAKNIFELATGQSPAAAADAVSRYMTAAIGYNFYKNKGIKDPAKLLHLVEEFTDKTMVMYSKKHSAPMYSKMGVVGDASAPLTKYVTAQLGNFINDLKLIHQTEGGKAKLAATLPALSTFLTTMVMGGAFGTIMAAEYEMIRSGASFIWRNTLGTKEDFEEYFPPLEKAILENKSVLTRYTSQVYNALGMDEEKSIAAAQYGIVSALTGFDIGSGLRAQPYIGSGFSNFESGPLDIFPAVNYAVDTAKNVLTIGRYATEGNVTRAEYRTAAMNLGWPVVGAKAVVDRLKFDADTRPGVPDATHGFEQVPQNLKEEVSTLIGSRTMERAKLRNLHYTKQEQMQWEKDLTKQIDITVDSLMRGVEVKNIDRLVKAAEKLGYDSATINHKLENSLQNRFTPEEDRYLLSKGKVNKRTAFKFGQLHDVSGVDE